MLKIISTNEMDNGIVYNVKGAVQPVTIGVGVYNVPSGSIGNAVLRFGSDGTVSKHGYLATSYSGPWSVAPDVRWLLGTFPYTATTAPGP